MHHYRCIIAKSASIECICGLYNPLTDVTVMKAVKKAKFVCLTSFLSCENLQIMAYIFTRGNDKWLNFSARLNSNTPHQLTTL